MPRKKNYLSRLLLLTNAILLLLQSLIMSGYFPIKGLLPPVLIPLLLLGNVLFFGYWMLSMRWPFVLFLVFFLLNFQEWSLLFKFPNNAIGVSDGFRVMSFNVRLFNQFNWISEKHIPMRIAQFIDQENPDIVCLQEYSSSTAPAFSQYPFRYIKTASALGNNGVAILSKFPLLQTGQINFAKSANSGIFADIKYQQDTLRIYNLHLESYQLTMQDSIIDSNTSTRFLKRLDGVYQKQLAQVMQWQQVENFNENPSLICVDLNNTAFSEAYRKLCGSHQDAFVEAGQGFGSTYSLGGIPYRIDFIFSSKRLRIINYETHRVKLSDHRPISAKFRWD